MLKMTGGVLNRSKKTIQIRRFRGWDLSQRIPGGNSCIILGSKLKSVDWRVNFKTVC